VTQMIRNLVALSQTLDALPSNRWLTMKLWDTCNIAAFASTDLLLGLNMTVLPKLLISTATITTMWHQKTTNPSTSSLLPKTKVRKLFKKIQNEF
jgi:hypothetical protein